MVCYFMLDSMILEVKTLKKDFKKLKVRILKHRVNLINFGRALYMCKDCGCSITEGGHVRGDASAHHHHNHHHNHNHQHSGQRDRKKSLFSSKTIEAIENVLKENNKQAEANRLFFEQQNAICINLMSSPGSGKTTLLEQTIAMLGADKVGVIEGDLETNNDANRIRKKGAQAHQIMTGQTCHLDAFSVSGAIDKLKYDKLDFVFVENVGNLVCPASYDVGSHMDVVLLSVTEGDDKPLKYPVIFKNADLVLITKTDLIEHMHFDVSNAIKYVKRVNPKIDIMSVSSESKQGLKSWIDFIKIKRTLKISQMSLLVS